MTQIVDKRLKKMCDECHSHLDKPCAWLSLGNEYCTEIMDIQQELQRKDNIINELKKWTNSEIKRLEKYQNDKKYVKPYGQEYNNFTLLISAYDNVLDKIKELEEK